MDTRLQRALKDGLAGLVFVAFGLAFAILATAYSIGSTDRMGPGYFPFVLGGLLVVLGGAILGRALLDGEGESIGSIPWRALALIFASILSFGLTVRGLGVGPSVFITALLCAFASRRNGPVSAVAIALGLTVLGTLIFVVALSLRLPIIGPWLGD